MASKRVRLKVQVHLWRRDPETEGILYLVLRRYEAKGGIWQPVTGNIDPDEDLETCARREVEEETGLKNLVSCREIRSFEFEKGGKTFRETVYAAEAPAGDVALSGEHAAARWVSFEEARRLIHFESNRESLDAVRRAVETSSQS